ncbi:hypothetical protein EV421DRAFT_1806456 [Armillaria borealis]|uniref:DUF6697 domain-containing protein n=1 Tax=Armillaria borealis TaxID=47425 RepID=A0AA39MQG9_9AGAR|nr:hypothetical protein EV421DRAFT_1806456 [Armillaria borealis]
MTQSNATENSAAYDIFEQLQAEILKPEQERNEMLTTLCRQMRDDADKQAEMHEKTQLALDRASESVRALEDSWKRRFEMHESHLAHKVSALAFQARAFHREVVDLVDEAELHRRKQISDLFPTKFTPDVVHDTMFTFKDIDNAMQVVKTHIGNVEYVCHPREPHGLRIRTTVGQSGYCFDAKISGNGPFELIVETGPSEYTYYGRYISSRFGGDEYMHLSEWHTTDPEARYICAQAIAHEGLQPGQVPARIDVLSIMRDLDFGDRRISAHQLQCVGYNPLLRYRLHTIAQSVQAKIVGEQSKTKKRLRASS